MPWWIIILIWLVGLGIGVAGFTHWAFDVPVRL